MKSVAIMQPYLFPYIGYYQLIRAVDEFIVYDNIKYTKKGWINRNRLLMNGREVVFTVPLKKDSDSLDVKDREISGDFKKEELLNRIREGYRRSPYFEQVFPLVERIVLHDEVNLFRFLHNSIVRTCEHIGVDTQISVSSNIHVNHDLRSQDKVLALCEAVGASTYVNPIGGMALYSKQEFAIRGIELKFIKPGPFVYPQFGNEFVPRLSIIDVMMFNPIEAIRECLATNYELI